jgi:hypothetical protein
MRNVELRRLKMNRASAIVTATLAAATVAVFLPTASLAETCKNGICVHGHQEGNTLFVDFRATVARSHYNFNDGSGQREIGANETQVRIPIRGRGVMIHYAFQACTGGGTFSRSRCTPWANFSHTVR